MKKSLFLLFIVALIISGCGKKENEGGNPAGDGKVDTTGVLNTTKDNNPPHDIKLTYQLKKGEHYSFRMTSVTSNSQSIIADSSMSQKMHRTITYLFDMNVDDVDSDNIMDIKINVKSIKLDADAGGQKLSYQSGNKLNEKDRQTFLEYEALINSPFTVRMDPQGEILEIYHVDRVANKLLDLQKIRDSVTSEQKKQLQQSISEGALKPMVQQIFRVLPKHQISIDSTWNFSQPSQLGVFTVQNITKYKLAGFEMKDDQRLALIEAGLDIVAKGKNKFTERGVDYDFKTPQADGTGKIYFNVAKGCIQYAKTKVSLKTSMTMKAQNKKATRNDMLETTNIIELL